LAARAIVLAGDTVGVRVIDHLIVAPARSPPVEASA
jgi:hypothetical protein